MRKTIICSKTMADIPPSKTFVAELKFKQSYNIDEEKKFDDDVRRAKAIIEERLPVRVQLNLISVVA